jgi:hypothetical protein
MVQRSSSQLLPVVATLLVLAAACAGDISAEEQLADDTQSDDAGTSSAAGDASRDGAARDGAVPGRGDGVVSGRDGAVARAADAAAQPAPGDGSPRKTLRVEGRRILDTCGKPWMARGVEQLAAKSFSADGSLGGLASELVKTGSNAVRLLPQNLTASEIDGLLTRLATDNVVVYLSPGDRAWFKRSDIREVLLRHEKGLIIDAFQEPNYDDVPRWIKESKAAVAELRAAGYVAPFTVLSNQYGRDLTAALEHGQEIVDADPQHNTIVGWQAYWGKSGWYQRDSGMTLTQGVEKCAAKGFAMQVGIDLYADKNDPMDYPEVMAAAQRQGLGWLWWNFWNQWDDLGNNASMDGTAARLTASGQAVLHSDANSIARTAQKACFR